MYCVWKRGMGDGNFLVYDLGGGTFDVSIIRCLMGEYQVLGIHGDNYLGGDDFDRRLAERFRVHLSQQGYRLELDVVNNADDAVRFLLLTRVARRIKESLSFEEVVYVAQQDLFKDQAGEPVTLEMELTRGEWERLMADLIESTVRCCHSALEQSKERAGVDLADIDTVLLVGGSTRVPLVQRRVAEAFCGAGRSRAEAPTIEAPDSCVALGAAIHAANLGGVIIGADDSEVRLAVATALATRAGTIRVSGALSGLEANGATLLLKDVNAATLAVEVLDGERFKLTDVPLVEDGANPMVLEILDKSGNTRAELPLTLYRNAELKTTGSALSNPTVLAKDLQLEVQQLGELERKILLPRGRTLPAHEEFRLFTADQSGAVILTLLQNRYPISTLHLEVPEELAVGTPVSLELEVDESMTITASGQVGGQKFWARVEPPSLDSLKDWPQIEALLLDAERLAPRLWGQEAKLFRSEAPFLMASIREAVRTDPDKLHALVARLEDLMEYLRGTPGELSPGFNRYEAVLDTIRRFALKADSVLGMTFEAWKARIDDFHVQGERAFKAKDQALYGKLYTQLQALVETLNQEETRFVKTNSLEHVQDLLRSAQFRLLALHSKLTDVVIPANPETRRLREAALASLKSDLTTTVEDPLADVAGRLEGNPAVRGELDRILLALKLLDKRLEALPALGVVTTG